MAPCAAPKQFVLLSAASMHHLRRGAAIAARLANCGRPRPWGRWAAAAGAPVVVASLTTSHNPFDFDSARQKHRLLARMETSVDEADEPM